jgi:hypothetical protein
MEIQTKLSKYGEKLCSARCQQCRALRSLEVTLISLTVRLEVVEGGGNPPPPAIPGGTISIKITRKGVVSTPIIVGQHWPLSFSCTDIIIPIAGNYNLVFNKFMWEIYEHQVLLYVIPNTETMKTVLSSKFAYKSLLCHCLSFSLSFSPFLFFLPLY